MDIATGLGLVAGVIVLLSLIFMGGDISMFLDSHAFIVIFGGAFAATLIRFPLTSIFHGLPLGMKFAFTMRRMSQRDEGKDQCAGENRAEVEAVAFFSGDAPPREIPVAAEVKPAHEREGEQENRVQSGPRAGWASGLFAAGVTNGGDFLYDADLALDLGRVHDARDGDRNLSAAGVAQLALRRARPATFLGLQVHKTSSCLVFDTADIKGER